MDDRSTPPYKPTSGQNTLHKLSPKASTALVQVVGPTDNWILERLARRLVAKLPYAEFSPWTPRLPGRAGIAYYINYALYHGPTPLLDGGFFTHADESQKFLWRAQKMDFCVCMSKLYADWLVSQGVETVVHIPMGFDFYRYRSRLVVGVIGKLDHPRKGLHLVEEVRKLPFVEVVTTQGTLSEHQLRDVYQLVDFVLIPAIVEGGPMSLLEGLAMGKLIIAPENVGIVPEFGETAHIRTYPAGNLDALVELLEECFEEKLQRVRLVQDRTLDRWAAAHHELFEQVLRERSMAMPTPAPAFRFGMMSELDIPPTTDVGVLEAAVDRAAAHLFYGRNRSARSVLLDVRAQYPFVEKLVETIPRADDRGRPAEYR